MVAPDMLDRRERQPAAMALDEAAHHIGLTARPERRAGLAGALDAHEGVDDTAALDEQAVHGIVDAVDLAAQIVEGFGRFCHGRPRYAAVRRSQRNVDFAETPDLRCRPAQEGQLNHMATPKPVLSLNEAARREADVPQSRVARFGPESPLTLDCGVTLVALPDRLQDLWRAQCRPLQRGADLPRSDRRPACRQRRIR